MNNTDNNEITDDMIKKAGSIVIISGEGAFGIPETYTGVRTARAVKKRLTEERCGGERWAVLTVDGQRV